MAKQTKSTTVIKPSSEECHDAAVRAILHVVDEALSEGTPLSHPKFTQALEMLAQQGNLKKWYKDNLISYDMAQLRKLVSRIVHQVDVTKYNGSLEELLRHGSSCIVKGYLRKMGLVDDDHDELSADHSVELLAEHRVREDINTTNETEVARIPRRRDFCT